MNDFSGFEVCKETRIRVNEWTRKQGNEDKERGRQKNKEVSKSG